VPVRRMPVYQGTPLTHAASRKKRTFLPQLGLALLHRGDEEVTNGGGGQTVKATLDTWRGREVGEGARARVRGCPERVLADQR
jgi:hypothetical protein